MIRLDFFTENDFEQLMGWVNDTSERFFMQWSGPTFTYPLTCEQLKDYIKNADPPEGGDRIYKAVHQPSGETIGHLAIRKIDRFHNSARLGKVLIAPEWRGMGLAVPMIEKALTEAFETEHLHRLALGVFSFNRPAYRLYRKVGFREEGYFRDFRRVGDEYWDMYEMSMLAPEYKKKKEGS
ncbi:GNAT family N-acetyltransferase [Alteribacter natronophilus]|uniref:GNAT family N-acetyltransferase n=1 Tax=Alteribacter natronophilus TaxID=2583810 RepID=UPI00110EB741|nr:GNAT family protein [Alteribacter natronophilus]TMW70305.1 GNAT family N-acetyltransferase [Alteribacter natronophilus]